MVWHGSNICSAVISGIIRFAQQWDDFDGHSMVSKPGEFVYRLVYCATYVAVAGQRDIKTV